MYKIRTTKTGSGNTAVQVVYRHNQKTKIIKHIGTARNDQEVKKLADLANQYILSCSPIRPIFPEIFKNENESNHLVSVENLAFTKTYHHFSHEFLSFFYEMNGFHTLQNDLLRDLAFMRIIEPSSKLHSILLFNKYFGDTYTQNMLYKNLPQIRFLKESAERIAVSYAQKNLGFDFSVVFYDVTTLYFETFKTDEDRQDTGVTGLRKPGFSKDNKPLQPQVMIGLVVNQDGYPVAIDMFPGNTFEGHTIIPMLRKLQKTHTIKTLTIVADAGMLSQSNLEEIEKAGLTYIVGARLGNVSIEQLKRISTNLNRTEGIYDRSALPHGILICDYSQKRANKDKSDRQKQLLKAQYQIDNPDKTKRRTRFVMEASKATVKLNQALIDKDVLREGLKGYHTNLESTESTLIVQRYKDLWHVEKSFRIAKSDLQARPIFHHKRESIETHILIVFISLCLAKSIELKTNFSIKRVRDMIWDILDIEFNDILTNKKFLRRMETTDNPMANLMKKMKPVLKG